MQVPPLRRGTPAISAEVTAHSLRPSLSLDFRDREGLIAYPSPMKGFSVVQDNTGVIQVVDRYP